MSGQQELAGGLLLGCHLLGQVTAPVLFAYTRRRRGDLPRLFVAVFAGSWIFQSAWDGALLFLVVLNSSGARPELLFAVAVAWMLLGAAVAYAIVARLIPKQGRLFE